jgi:hypothetical protein
MWRLGALCALATLATAKVHQKGLHILQPRDLRGDISHTEASFGIPSFAASITGKLFYQWNNPLGCDGFDHLRGDVTILLVDRGNCTFVQKVRAAEEASANAVIVVDNTDDGPTIIMADDGSGTSVSIPSVFISKADGDKLKEALDPVHHNGKVMVKLTWDIPSPDNHVEWELWTSSNDDNSIEFKHQFQLPATRLGLNHTFTPHFLTIDGDWFDCTTKTGLPPPHDWRCGKQCTNSGRYCAEDPEQDQGSGRDGEDVVMENVRQICLWGAVNATGQEGIWWDYVEAFHHNCSKSDATFNQACSEGLMRIFSRQYGRPSQDLLDDVRHCVDASGGTGFEDGPNTILEAEIKARVEEGVFMLPTIRINEKDYRGDISCPTPVSLGTCPVLAAICDGFMKGGAPPVCKPDYCWDTIDVCGVCGGDGMSCRGCDNVPQLDPAKRKKIGGCEQSCGGSGTMDLCGRCYALDSPARDTGCEDVVLQEIKLRGIDSVQFKVDQGEFAEVMHQLVGASGTTNTVKDVEVLSVVDDPNSTNDAKEVTVTLNIHTKRGRGVEVRDSMKRSIENESLTQRLEAAQIHAVATDEGLPEATVREGETTSTTPAQTTVVHNGVSSGALAAIVLVLVGALFSVAVGSKYYMQKREAHMRTEMRTMMNSFMTSASVPLGGADTLGGSGGPGPGAGGVGSPVNPMHPPSQAMRNPMAPGSGGPKNPMEIQLQELRSGKAQAETRSAAGNQPSREITMTTPPPVQEGEEGVDYNSI